MVDDETAVAGRYLDALGRLDADGMLAELHDDVVLEIPHAPEGLPKRVEGKVAVEAFIRPVVGGLWKELQILDVDVRSEADRERLVAEYTSKGSFANGQPYANTYVNLLRVRGGKIVETKEFFDVTQLLPGLGQA